MPCVPARLTEGDELLGGAAPRGRRRRPPAPWTRPRPRGVPSELGTGNGEGVRAGQWLRPLPGERAAAARWPSAPRRAPSPRASPPSSRRSPSERLRGDDEACADRRVESCDSTIRARTSSRARRFPPSARRLLDDGALRRGGRIEVGQLGEPVEARVPCPGRVRRSASSECVRERPCISFREAEPAAGGRLRVQAETSGRRLQDPPPTPCSRLVDAIAGRGRRSPARPPSPDRSRRSPPPRPTGRRGADRTGSCPSRFPRPRGRAPPLHRRTEELVARPGEIGRCSRRRRGGACSSSRHLRGADGDLLRARCGVVTTTASARGRSSRARSPRPPSRAACRPRSVSRSPQWTSGKLLERPVQFWPAPHDRRVLVEEEADGHDLQVALTGGTIILLTATGRWLIPSIVGIEYP